MSDSKGSQTPKEAGGYEHDLREAENAMTAAGHPDIALGMRRHSEAQRNMMQGVLVPMFVAMVEKTLGPKLDGLRSDVQAWAAESAARLGKNEADVEALREIVANNTARLDLFEAKVAEDIQRRLVRIENIIADRPNQRAAEHQALLKAINGVRVVVNDADHDGD